MDEDSEFLRQPNASLPIKGKASTMPALQGQHEASPQRAQTRTEAYLSLPRRKYAAVGFWPVFGVPREDYEDFLGGSFWIDEVRAMLRMGVLPPGLILQQRGQAALQVWGAYESVQRLEPLTKMIRIR